MHEHPQESVPPTVLLKSAERVMVDMVNLAGLRINTAIRKVFLQSALQFVAGLGPRTCQRDSFALRLPPPPHPKLFDQLHA
jgi:transcription elongation factor SPT6